MSQKLIIKPVRFTIRINDDSGSGARKRVITWKPELPEGWYYLGPIATVDDEPPRGAIVHELAPGALGQIADWVPIWNDTGSKRPTNYSIWRAVPEDPDYIALAGFFMRSHDKPTAEDTEGIRAIHKDLVTRVKGDLEIWNDAGSGARAEVSVWAPSTTGNPHAISTGAFIPVHGYKAPPEQACFAINRDAVITEGV